MARAVTSPSGLSAVPRRRQAASRCGAVMRHALLAKIQSNPGAREVLFATGTATLVADANCVSYWFENHHSPFNAIGRMLMSIREELLAQPAAASAD